MLIHKDMKNYVMDEETDQFIQKKLKDVHRKGEQK